MSFVQRRARLGDMTPVNGSSYTNPDGSPTYDTLPYNEGDANNPYNYDSIYNDTYNAPYAGPAAAPAINLPTTGLFSQPISAYVPPPVTYVPPPVTYVPPLAYSPQLPPVNVTPAPAAAPQPAISLASLLGPISSLLNPGAAATPVKSVVPAGAAPKTAAPTIAGLSTSTLLLVGVGLGAFLLLKKKRR